MEVLGRGDVLNVAGKAMISARRKLWEAKANEANKELMKRIIETKMDTEWQGKEAVLNVKPKVSQRKLKFRAVV